MSRLTSIPGIGKTFERDFQRIGIQSLEDLVGRDPDELFADLTRANSREQHATSKNYLYVLRMAVYFAQGGRDPDLLVWHAWKK